MQLPTYHASPSWFLITTAEAGGKRDFFYCSCVALRIDVGEEATPQVGTSSRSANTVLLSDTQWRYEVRGYCCCCVVVTFISRSFKCI